MQVSFLSEYFSEFSLIKFRVLVEVEYFISLCEIPLPQLVSFGGAEKEGRYAALRAIYKQFTQADAEKVKAFEKVTNHDVKAVEYFLKERYRIALLPLSSTHFDFDYLSRAFTYCYCVFIAVVHSLLLCCVSCFRWFRLVIGGVLV